jgi:SWI/SNF-related matrix-associated actin-dependent regulator of chromatin subfamily A member 5
MILIGIRSAIFRFVDSSNAMTVAFLKYLQAQDRAHRIGQKKPVKVFRFVTEKTVEEKVVERALAKLRLDTMVIQQGRLVEQNKALSSAELLNMVRHGADEIVSSTAGSDLTDEDIDAILMRGEAKTEEAEEQLKKKIQDLGGNMQEFRLDSTDDFNYREFDGVDYQEGAKNLKELLVSNWEDGPRLRAQRSTYNIDDYYRGVMKSEGKPKKGPLPRPPKQPTIYDFQFYPDRLYELFEKETAAYRRRLEARKAGRSEEDEDFGDLTEEEEAAKDKMLQQGFSNWSRKDFSQFIKACERHGRKDVENVTSEIEGKTEKEVRAYLKAFKTNYKKINGWERFIDRIEKGEEKLQRLQEMQDALAKKVLLLSFLRLFF